MFEKINNNKKATIRPSNLIYCDWILTKSISILQPTHKQGNPSFHFHAPGSERRYPCTQTASAVPKYVPCLLQFCTSHRIWHAPRISKRKRSKTLIFTELEIYNQHFFAIFGRVLLIDLRPIHCSLTCLLCQPARLGCNCAVKISPCNHRISTFSWPVRGGRPVFRVAAVHGPPVFPLIVAFLLLLN